MSADTGTVVHQELDDRIEKLIVEFRHLPAGIVLRAFARAVGEVRRIDGLSRGLPADAEARARAALTAL